jgi:citrate synthase
MDDASAVRLGLEGVVAAETVLSHVDGERGRIWVRGVPLEDLVTRHGWEGAIALLWEGFVGTGLTRGGIVAELGDARKEAFPQLDRWLDAARRRPLSEAVRMCLAALPDDGGPATLVGRFTVGLAALLRARDGASPVAPDPALDTATDLLRMAHGAPVEPRFAQALETYMTTVSDNGLAPSTFAARVVASTRAPLAPAVVAGYCAFVGPLHGGAPGPVLDMLDEIAASGDVDGWLERTLSAGGRLIGFGHRVFRVRDPRADILRGVLTHLGPDVGRLAFADDVERRAIAALRRFKPGRTLEPNLEMNAALLLDAVGVPRDAFTPVFALARMPSWIAHALEEQRNGRLIRPAARYVGPLAD